MVKSLAPVNSIVLTLRQYYESVAKAPARFGVLLNSAQWNVTNLLELNLFDGLIKSVAENHTFCQSDL